MLSPFALYGNAISTSKHQAVAAPVSQLSPVDSLMGPLLPHLSGLMGSGTASSSPPTSSPYSSLEAVRSCHSNLFSGAAARDDRVFGRSVAFQGSTDGRVASHPTEPPPRPLQASKTMPRHFPAPLRHIQALKGAGQACQSRRLPALSQCAPALPTPLRPTVRGPQGAQ